MAGWLQNFGVIIMNYISSLLSLLAGLSFIAIIALFLIGGIIFINLIGKNHSKILEWLENQIKEILTA